MPLYTLLAKGSRPGSRKDAQGGQRRLPAIRADRARHRSFGPRRAPTLTQRRGRHRTLNGAKRRIARRLSRRGPGNNLGKSKKRSNRHGSAAGFASFALSGCPTLSWVSFGTQPRLFVYDIIARKVSVSAPYWLYIFGIEHDFRPRAPRDYITLMGIAMCMTGIGMIRLKPPPSPLS